MKIYLGAAFAWMLVGSSVLSAESLPEKAKRVHEVGQQSSEGVVLGEIKGGTKKFGMAGAVSEGGEAPSPSTLFEIGSITKVFTAILLAESVREGKVEYSDAVGEFLPESALGGEDSPLRSAITLESLATHRSGLPRLPGDLFDQADPENPYAHYDVEALYSYLETVTTDTLESPGEFSYSNLGFAILGHVMELIWEKPYPELVKEKIFNPLGMNDSLVPTDYGNLPEGVRKHLASGHRGGKAVSHWELGIFLGAGAILSSADDLLTFAEGHWSKEAPEGLAASLLEVTEKRAGKQGLAWFVMENGGVNHNGATGGFASSLTLNPAKQTAEVTLSNSGAEKLEQSSEGDFSTLEGFWEGTLEAGETKLRLVHYIGADGRAVSFSIDQGSAWTWAVASEFENEKLRMTFPTIGGIHKAVLKGDELKGTWSQGKELPLNLSRAKGIPEILSKALSKKFIGDVSKLKGYWSGYLGGKAGLFVYFKVEELGGVNTVDLFSPDQTEAALPVTKTIVKGDKVEISVRQVGGKLSGELDPTGKKISGIWKQGVEQPIKLTWSAEKPSRE